MRFWLALKALLLNTLFPPTCVSCKKEGDFFCAECLGSLAKRRISPKVSKTDDEPELHHLDGVIYALDYAKNPQIQAAISQFKYRFTQELAAPFADLIAEKIRELSMVKNRKIILIPIPLHAKRLAYRGFNQAEVIAKAIQSHLPAGKSELQPLLVREKETKQQARLTKEERHKNLEGAFHMNNNFVQSFDPKAIHFLVDDVCTTGSTLENCARVLKENGVPKIYGLVIARAFRRE